MSVFDQVSKVASQVTQLPVLRRLSPAANIAPTSEQKSAYLKSQRLAFQSVKEVAALIQPGWTEKKAALLIETYLRDHGVQAFFHFPFAWWGDRARFMGVKNYYDYLPTERVLQENETFILDVAPIYNGYIADIGYSSYHGDEDPEWAKAKDFLYDLRKQIPELFSTQNMGDKIWQTIDHKIDEQGYENIHEMYPFSVLGHRVHQTNEKCGRVKFIHFGWQSYWSLTSRGILGQLLNHNFRGDLKGLWAIEPHIGFGSHGLKFEEILVVEDDKVYWLEEDFENEGW